MIKKTTFIAEAKNWGNSMGIIIPAKVVDEFGIKPGTLWDVDIRKSERINGRGILKGLNCKELRKEPEDDRVERMIRHFEKKYGKRR